MATQSEPKAKVGPVRPTDAKIRKLHERLKQAQNALEREAIYKECGLHPVALGRWFRMLGLEKLGPAQALTKKRKPGRPRKGTAKAKLLSSASPKRKTKNTGEEPKLARGLSPKARETAIELLRLLLTE